MDWTKSYSASWRVFRVNRNTWADGQQVSNIDSFSLSRTADGSLLESGGLEAVGNFDSDYYRIVMTAEQGGDIDRVDVATLLFDLQGGKIDYGRDVHDVDGFSVLYPASTTAVTTGAYAPAGVNGAEYAAELLKEAINAPVVVEGEFYLNDHIAHEVGSTVLDAVWDVLNAGNFVLQIDGRGVVHILPKPTEPALIIGNINSGMLMNGIDYTADMSEIPNRYVVMENNTVTIAENNDPDSVVSTVNRGYYVDEIDTSPTPVNGETYSEYANRMLEEESILKEERTYKREYAPDVYPYSIVKGSINGLDGNFRVKSQSINGGHGITVNEKAERETKLWRR